MKRLLIAPFLLLGGRMMLHAQTGVLFTPQAVQLGQVNGTSVLVPQGLAYVSVCQITPTGCTAATVYSDKALQYPLPQPFQADALGNITFYAAPGDYTATVCPQSGAACFPVEVAGGNGLPPALATDTTPGIVQLAPNQASSTLSTVATTGDYDDLANKPTTVVNVSSYPGADLSAQLTAADAAFAGSPATFTLSGTLSEPVTLSAYHNLYLTAPLNFNNTGGIIPTQYNTIQCDAGGALVNTGMGVFGVNEINPFVLVPSGAAEAQHLRITGCRVEGWPNSNGFAQLFFTSGAATDITIDHNDIHNAQLFIQHGAGSDNPSLRWNVGNNRVVWDAGEAPKEYCANVYGAWQFSTFHDNTCEGTTGGIELFAETPTGAEGNTNPPESGVYTGGLGDDQIVNNIFHNIGGQSSAVFVSLGYRMLVQGNLSNGSDDVSFDIEANVDSSVLNNQATEFHTSGMGTFYTSIRNRFAGNTLTTAEGNFGFMVKNAGGYPYINTDTVVEGNHYRSTNGIGGFALLEAAQRMTFKDNDIYNGPIAYGTSYNPSQLWQNNVFTFTYPLLGSSVVGSGGYGSGRSAGLTLGNYQDGTYEIARGNTLITTVQQPSPYACIAGGLSESNPPAPVAMMERNACVGPWTTDFLLNSASTNSAVIPTFILDGNDLAAGVVTTSSSTGVNPHVVCRNNYSGANAVNCSQ